MKYQIYQINFDANMVKRINDYEPTATKIFNLYLDTTGINPQPEAIMKAVSLYRHCADIEADHLEHVFHIGNMGPEHFITRYRQMHSVSVGDVIIQGDEAWYVASFGFNKLPDFIASWTALDFQNTEFFNNAI